ncbi:MAG: heavy metal translocating P-type ATPase, partial [Arthrobacter sp.]
MRKPAAPPAATGGSPGSLDAGGSAGSPVERAWGFMRRYPVVALTCVVLAAVLVLLQFGLELQVRVLASAYAAVIVVARSAGMVRSLREGRWGIDLLALMAIVSTVVVGEYLAALVVILMLTGGEALEDFAQGRAARELRSLLDRAPRFA